MWHTNENYGKVAQIFNEAAILIAILPELSWESPFLLIYSDWIYVSVRFLRHKGNEAIQEILVGILCARSF